MVSDTAELRSCPWFGDSRSGDRWCSPALPSASGACGLGCPPAAALSESTSPCRLSCETKRDNVFEITALASTVNAVDMN